MSDNPDQIYSATYSNVPVFEFVTEEGPIMRRKSDSWINATHILKIAKFPKARRTRILEKDVQTGVHEKVQGGYGKYQGTYVPLEIGVEIAKTFAVFDLLRPIFEFKYVEGKSETPPPAPKHNHASASNVARRQQQQKQKAELNDANDAYSAKRMKISASEAGDLPKRRGRPKRVALTPRDKPELLHSRTVPIDSSGPSMGTFSARREHSFSQNLQLPPLMRQDTERDALQVMASNLNVKREDLEAESSDNDDHVAASALRPDFGLKDTDDDELMTGKELFGSRDSFATRESFEKIVHMHNRNSRSSNIPRLLSLNGSVNGDSYGLNQYHHQNNFPQSATTSIRGDPESVEYFNTLLNYFLDDEGSQASSAKARNGTLELPENILNPPQPLNKININQPIDNDGNTIFHWACSMGNISMIEFLLSIFTNFIDSEVKNYHGETPLMFLIQFNNSYQLKNFPAILDLLFDSILSVDNYGRTILHHIALACGPGRRELSLSQTKDDDSRVKKERFAKYYMDVVFAKIIDIPDYQLLQGNQNRSLEDKKEFIAKFINHQDNEGNTAFHIVAYNLAKKLIKIFISYHKHIDFGLRNLVNYTVEDYLASHNYVLRLENGDDDSIPTQEDKNQIQPTLFAAEHTQSFESQLHRSKLAIHLQNTTANLITEKLSELAFAVDKELGEKDEKLSELYKVLRVIVYDKFRSQKSILEIFNLENLVKDVERDFEGEVEDSARSTDPEALVIDGSRDKIIQDEINRLYNDLLFQYLSIKDDVDREFERFKHITEVLANRRLKQVEEKSVGTETSDDSDEQKLSIAKKLQEQIIKRRDLSSRIYEEGSKWPISVRHPDDYKENQEGTHQNEENSGNPDKEGALSSEAGSRSAIADFPQEDKLYKYCKLISLSCGMSFSEVETSIDLIEQSLEKSSNSS